MHLLVTVLLVTFFAFILIGTPIVISIGFASTLAILTDGSYDLVLVAQRMFVSLDSFSLLAIPLFILAGDLMLLGGISKRLIRLAESFLCWSRGSLAYVTVVASAFFGAISGSAPATTAAIGSMMYNEMKEKGYNLDFSALLAAFAGTLGVIIPPSIGLVVIGTQTGTSVTKLFMVSAVAGVLLAVAYCFASKLSIAKSTSQMPVKKVSGKEVWDSFKDAIAGIVSPLIILGGIYSGMFTATESAVIAVVYSLIVGIFVYRELNPKVIVDCVIKSALTSSMVLILISVASLYSWLLTVGGTAMQIKNFVLSLNLTPLLFLVVASLIYLLLGMIIEGIPIIVLTAPILFPIAVALGIDPVLFGVITMLNIAYGNVTPPFGLCLFVASGFSKRNIIDMAKKGVFLYSIGMAMIILFCAFPGIIMWIIK